MEASQLREQTDQGRRARITEKVLDDAFGYLETECLQKFRESSIHDAEGHMAVKLYLKISADIKDYLKMSIYNGQAARKALIKTLANPEETHAPRNPT